MLLEILLVLWIIAGGIILWEKNILRMLIWLGLVSFIAAITFFMIAAPDVAMAEAAISGFAAIFFIVCFEKYYLLRDPVAEATDAQRNQKTHVLTSYGLPLILIVVLFGLFLYFIPPTYPDSYLKAAYLRRAAFDVGGENVVGAIILGYRVFDTLFEALMLVVAVVATIHMSAFSDAPLLEERRTGIEKDRVALFLMRIIAPITLVFGVYLIANGFLTAGGGFQGGLAIAAFFIVRYMVYDIYDISMAKVNRMEKLVFTAISLIAILIVFQNLQAWVPEHLLPGFQVAYLILMNTLIGLKVACGFLILFYRYIAIERN